MHAQDCDISDTRQSYHTDVSSPFPNSKKEIYRLPQPQPPPARRAEGESVFFDESWVDGGLIERLASIHLTDRQSCAAGRTGSSERSSARQGVNAYAKGTNANELASLTASADFPFCNSFCLSFMPTHTHTHTHNLCKFKHAVCFVIMPPKLIHALPLRPINPQTTHTPYQPRKHVSSPLSSILDRKSDIFSDERQCWDNLIVTIATCISLESKQQQRRDSTCAWRWRRH